MLDRQINLFKVDTSAFLTESEKAAKTTLVRHKKILNRLFKKVNCRKSDLKETYKNLIKRNKLSKYEEWFIVASDIIGREEKEWKEFLLNSAADSVANSTVRTLDERYLSYIDKDGNQKINLSNVIAMFESSLSRSFGVKQDELTYDIFVLEIYYYDIAQDLILNGFNYNGNHYVYFSSSAGQIRTKKAVFVNEEKYLKCQKKLMCGLTIDKINEKGGMNVNKFLAYTALANSATDIWKDVFGKEFDIDRSIVVDDFETLVDCTVDNINYETYDITPNVRMKIPIPHTDGCGLISSDYCAKNFMVRLPFIKGLLGSFDFRRFILKNGCSPKVKDIWGKEYDIFEDDIQIIFTKSQLKMHKYYSSWDEYKSYFKQYECEAGICNMEESKIPSAHINYQMLQTLYDATDEEIADLCRVPNDKIKEITETLHNALEFYGIYNHVDNLDYFQKSLKLYPELLNDPASKADLHDLKNSRVKDYRGGKLDVVGKFTFVLPDLYAFCEWLFLGEKIPKGLLDNNEVYCKLYSKAKELDCLRSPHLYIEHAIRQNVCDKKGLSDWFTTDAIYTSTYDPISRILQLDVDGDRLLVISQRKIIEIAKRCMQGINPLYYEMKKAKAEIITGQSLYNGLKAAFTGGKIGGISNDITKIWASGNICEDALNAVKWLCMETNFTINKSVA